MKPFGASQGKPQITFEDFSKLDLRIGDVVEARQAEGSEKLVELVVDFGLEIGRRTIYAGIRKWYEPASLVGRKLVFVVNLEPKKLKVGGSELLSEGMLLAALRQAQGKLDSGGEAVLYSFDKVVPSGTIIR